MKGREYCAKHGGKTRIGASHPAFKHGGHSKYMPTRLAEKYRESLEDPQLMEFRADAALLQARLHELLETGESLPLECLLPLARLTRCLAWRLAGCLKPLPVTS